MLIKDILTSFYNYSKGVFANINTVDKVYGITSGGKLTPNSTNTLGVDITECKGIMKNGAQIDIAAQTLTFDTTGNGIMRQDLVYIANDKTLKISKGTPSSMVTGSCTYTVNSVPVGDSGIINLMFPQYNNDGTQSTTPSTAHTYFRPGRDYTIGTTVINTASNLATALTNSTDNLFSYFFTFTAANGIITVTEKYPSGLTPYNMFECSFITAGTATVSSIPTFNNITYPSDLEFPIGICTVYSGNIFVGNASNYIPKSIKGGSNYYADNYTKVINNKIIKPNNLNKLGCNIKDFGAIGDGVTDDTNAFIEALNYGGTIYIPEGNYIINPSVDASYGDKRLTISNATSITLIGNRDKSKILIDGYFNFYTNYLKISGLTIQNKSVVNLIGTISNNNDTVLLTNYIQNDSTVIIEDCIISGYMNFSSFDYTIKNLLGLNAVIYLNNATKVNIDNLTLYNSPAFSNFDMGNGALKIQPSVNSTEKNDICKVYINNVSTYFYTYGIQIIGSGNSEILVNNANLCNCFSTAMYINNTNITINNCTGYTGGNMPATQPNFIMISNSSCIINNCRDLAFEGMKIPVDTGYLPSSSIGITSSKVIMNNCTWLYGVNNNGSVLSGINYDNSINTAISTIGNVKTAYLSAVPTTGAWSVGDTVYNTSAATGSPIGWKCTVAGTPGTWDIISAGSSSTTLSALTDVDESTAPMDGQGLIYDSASSKWKPKTYSTGGSSSTTLSANSPIIVNNADGVETISLSSINTYRQPNTTYNKGAIVYGASNLNLIYKLECYVSGKTGSSDISSWGNLNDKITDGEVTWIIKSSQNIVPIINISGTETIQDYQLETFFNLTGASYTVTVSEAVSGRYLILFNSGTDIKTIVLSSGIFIGPNGSNLSSLILEKNSVVKLISDGTNWISIMINNHNIISFSDDFHNQIYEGDYITNNIGQTNAPNALDLFYLNTKIVNSNIIHIAIDISTSVIYTEIYNGTYWSNWSSDSYSKEIAIDNTTNHNIIPTDINNYIRMNSIYANTVTFQDESIQSLPDNSEYIIRCANGNTTLVANGEVTLNAPANGTLVLSKGMTVYVKRVSKNVFDVYGETISVTTLLRMTFTVQKTINPFNLQPTQLLFINEQFSSTSQFNHYTNSTYGSYAVANNKITFTNTGIQDDIFTEGSELTMPQAFISINIVTKGTATSNYDCGGVGICKDENNYIWASWDSYANYARIQTRLNGTTNFYNTTSYTYPSSFKIGLSIVGNSLGVWINDGTGWVCKLTYNHKDVYNLMTVGNLTGWKAGFQVATGAASTWVVSDFKAGRFGTVCIRDINIVTNEDGTPVINSGNSVILTATVGDSTGTGYAGIFSLNLSTYDLEEIGVIMINRSNTIMNDLSFHIIKKSDGSELITISTWGNGFGGDLEILYGSFSSDIINGSNILSLSQLSIPKGTTGSGVYDPFLIYDSSNSRWLLAYTITDNTNFSNNPFYPALASSTDLTNWTLIAADTSHNGYENTKIVNDNNIIYITAGGPAGSGNSARVYDSNLNYYGILNAVFNGGSVTQPGAMVFDNGNIAYLITFDQTKYNGTDFTWGNLIIEQSSRLS